ncbi:MAG: hypothetical protein ABI333_12560 [bacterium]
MDLDYDGYVDNKGGLILQLLDSVGAPIQEHLDQRVLNGEVGMVVRIYAGSYQDDATVLARVLPVVSLDGTLLFDGADEVVLDPNMDEAGFGCGRIDEGNLEIEVGHGRQPLRCPFCPYSSALLTFHHVRLVGPIQIDSSGPLIIGGAVLPEDLRRILFPDLVTFANEIIADGGSVADTLVDFIDGNCVALDRFPVCSLFEPGEGECNDRQIPPVVTATEVLCNAIVYSATSPDLDTDGDGLADMISVGWQISVVPVSVIE